VNSDPFLLHLDPNLIAWFHLDTTWISPVEKLDIPAAVDSANCFPLAQMIQHCVATKAIVVPSSPPTRL